ncbi:MAG TPA: MBL fold metallo-hydrolase [Longimicrobium sp.]|jgi:glyoxylase-like metal-dependent hydrolase (beta-lactamase superfamily II)
MNDALKTLLAPNASPMTLDGTWTFIVGAERPVVIDPGPADPAHRDAILTALGGARPLAILLTHSHGDHSQLAPELARATGAPLMMAPGAVNRQVDAAAVDRWLAEDDVFGTDAGDLHVVATPGHAPEHVSFHWRSTGALFVGDTFMGQGDTTLVSPPEGDLAAYLDTLERVAALSPSILYPAHGPPITPAAAAIERYRQHRETRIAQVVHALRRGGPSHTAGLIDTVYGSELHPALRTAAQGSLEAILGYLTSVGQAHALPDGRYTLTRTDG